MSEFTYPPELEIVPLSSPVSATVTVPGSKSITNRALVLAALASRNGPCVLTGALRSEDTEVMLDCLTKLGFVLEADWRVPQVVVYQNPTDRIIPAEEADLFVANSGTTMRFLTAMVSVGTGRYRLDGVRRMRERPIGDLLSALRLFGVNAMGELADDYPPVVVRSFGWRRPEAPPIPGAAYIRSDVSSQFLSGLMLAAPFAGLHGVSILFDRLVSLPYLDMTDAMLHAWGIRTAFADRSHEFRVAAHPQAHRSEYAIEPDASAASYFWAAAAIMGGRVTVGGLNRKSLQGDVAFVDVLERMGCRVEECDAGITVHGRPLKGVDVDMNAISDTVMTLGAVALFADGPTTIRNVGHIRHKETDRIAALATELRKLGAEVEERADGLTITPRPLTGCAVDTYNDHRMAMSLALVGLKVPGVVIRNPGCVAKTYPAFWRDLDVLRNGERPV
ncbi:MAG TPA: 3-phosphoshikimate 1-carboxyvinyltransferase [Gemmataceae bacterium]|nr:3-phosphoshikimate 1-carboxyvinyltransferase [Gemmataceae bacterium]